MSMRLPVVLFDQVERVLDHRQRLQPEKIHLQQAEFAERIHRVLRDDFVLEFVPVVSGTILVNGSAPMTTPAACVEALRDSPSSVNP